ncbi:Peroxiredoxin [Algoriphagus locisalis]|uniref:Peroxiredoxin n=1 Tax=Algoriphagus locisalis TaxID=305507 RepID=A0A1I7D9F0_9BACT|nr:TlpA disulfide reductase family protein [Algoriphagus locisalis]SFU08319.1 Peroxiredoxin [Algoriphagus locisalis]
MYKIYFLTALVTLWAQDLPAQETVLKFKIGGKLKGQDFVAINFNEKGYQNSEGIEGELKAEYRKPLLLEFFHFKGSGKLLDNKSFWVGEGEYTISGSIEDLSTFEIDREHEYTTISKQIQAAEGTDRKKLILENLDKEVGVNSLIYNAKLFDQEEIIAAAENMPEELKELNSFKRLLAAAELPETGKLSTGTMSLDFRLESREEEEVSLSDYDGKYRLLEFSFSGCKPCIEALPEIKEIHERFGEDLQVISIWNDRSKNTWLNSSKKYKEIIVWTDLWDETGYVTKLYQIDVWPTYMLVAPDGTIEEIWKGYGKGRMLRKMENTFGKS